jgi:hypothetical protein
VDSVADQLSLGLGRREFHREGHRLVGAKTKSNPEFLRTCSLQSAPCRLAGERQTVADRVSDAVEDLRRLVVVRQDDRIALALEL